MTSSRAECRSAMLDALRALNQQAEKLAEDLDTREEALSYDELFRTLKAALGPGKDSEPVAKPSPEDLLRLNVGGSPEFVTTRRALTCLPTSALGHVFRQGWEGLLPKDQEGRIFLDLDPVQFRTILDWTVLVLRASPQDAPPPLLVDDLLLEQRYGFKELLRMLGIGSMLPKTIARLFSPPVCIGSKILTSAMVQELMEMLGPEGEGKHLRHVFHSRSEIIGPEATRRFCADRGPFFAVVKNVRGLVFFGFTGRVSLLERQISGSYSFHFGPGSSVQYVVDDVQDPDSAHCRVRSFGPFPDFDGSDLHFQITQGNIRVWCPMKPFSPLSFRGHPLAEGQSVQAAGFEVLKLCGEPSTQESKDAAEALQGTRGIGVETWSADATLASATSQVWKQYVQWQDAFQERIAQWQRAQELLPRDLCFLRHLAGRGEGGQDSPEIVYLNVRGVKLATFKATLQQHPSSMLAARFGERWTVQEGELVDGGVYFDEDPGLMALVLQAFRVKSIGNAELGEDSPPAKRRRVLPAVREMKAGAFEILAKYLSMEEVLITH